MVAPSCRPAERVGQLDQRPTVVQSIGVSYGKADVHSGPVLRLADGRFFSVRRASDIQLVTDYDFGGSRQRPVIAEITEADGEPVDHVRLAILDGHSIWLSHQAEIAPRSPRGAAVATGLSAAESVNARELFIKLVGPGTSSSELKPPLLDNPSRDVGKPWMRDALIAIAVPVIIAILLALLGLSK
jgi:hypothetical protein